MFTHVCTLVMIWNSFLGFMWAFVFWKAYRGPPLFSFFVLFPLPLSRSLLLVSSSEASPSHPCPIPVPVPWTSNTLIPGTPILYVSLTCGHFLTAVNHTLKVLSTTTHRSLWVLQCIITESINKGVNHWLLTCKEYAMAYENISIFNSFQKVTQKQMIMMQVK